MSHTTKDIEDIGKRQEDRRGGIKNTNREPRTIVEMREEGNCTLALGLDCERVRGVAKSIIQVAVASACQ